MSLKNYLLVLMVCYTSFVNAQQPTTFDILWGVKVPLRDGVNLNATVYKPDNQINALPLIVDITPYISDDYHIRGKYFSQQGYIYAVIDCRGRGSSEGIFDPLAQEAKDGYDVVEWFAKQPYCNGKISMWGGSYSGYNQWATAKEFPPHLNTIVPAASVHPGIDYPNPGNIFMSYTMSWLTFTSGKTGNTNIFGEGAFWETKYAEMYKNHLPFSQLDKIVGNETTVFQKWISHPSYDDFWQNMNPTQADYRKMNIPILTITGHYDADQLGAMTFYKDFMKFASAEAKKNKYLILGPWDHSGTRTPHADVGGLLFDKASLLDLNQLHKEWYDYTMKGGELPTFLKKHIAYYVVGDEKWKYADNLESIASELRTYYLSSNGVATAFQSGQLTMTIPKTDKESIIKYDPLNTTRGLIAKNEYNEVAYLKNHVEVISAGDEALVYHTSIFQDSTEVSGFPSATLFISSNTPDADIKGSLYEITAKGESILLSDQRLRLRYRESLETEKLMQPNQICKVSLDKFTFFSKRIPAGSRLRFVVSVINSINWQKNYGSGGVVANETAKDARTATIKLDMGKKTPSMVLIPCVK